MVASVTWEALAAVWTKAELADMLDKVRIKRRPFLGFVPVIAGIFLPVVARAGVPVVPTWIKNDQDNKHTTIILAADWNTNNEWDNLNGYYKGNCTIFVPTGWTVTIDFMNNSDRYPHSFILTRQFPESDLPLRLTEVDAVGGVMSRNAFDGLRPAEGDRVSFKVEPGNYFLASGKGVDLFEGDYIKLEVRDDFDKAMYLVTTEPVKQEDAPGRR
jgi:hypothetical protein